MKRLPALCLCSIPPDVALGTRFPTPSPEPRDDPPSCFSSPETSRSDATEVRIPSSAPVTHGEKTRKNSPVAVEGLRAFVRWPELRSFLFLQRPGGGPRPLAALGQSAVLVQLFRRVAQTEPGTPPERVLMVAARRDATGVDIWIENVQGECLRIRERREIKVGHVAIGISDKVRVAADGWQRWMSRFLLRYKGEVEA